MGLPIAVSRLGPRIGASVLTVAAVASAWLTAPAVAAVSRFPLPIVAAVRDIAQRDRVDALVQTRGSAPFVRMRRAIRRAALSGRKPWSDLRDLGDELAVPELRNLADIAAVAADGASVYNTLLAGARTLRHAELSDARSQANEVSERMSRPLALLVTGLTLFVLVPFLLRMFAGTA